MNNEVNELSQYYDDFDMYPMDWGSPWPMMDPFMYYPMDDFDLDSNSSISQFGGFGGFTPFRRFRRFPSFRFFPFFPFFPFFFFRRRRWQ